MERNIRKLASIRRIDNIKPIENADKIEIAQVGGWNVVVKKGEFEKDGLAIYCEIDCLMPERPEFEFLRAKHFRIRTMKMRGQISQGIIFPLSILGDKQNDFKEDEDISEYLGITKYEPPISPQLMGMAKGNFPTYLIPKTDEERIQNILNILIEMKDKLCYITQKETGTSFTAYHHIVNNMEISEQEQYIGVCSRNLELKNEAFPGSDVNIYWKIAKQYDIENKLKKFYSDTGRNIAIQGEITGNGIEKNPLGLPRNIHQLHLFNVYFIDEHRYANYEDFISVAKILEIPTVDVIYRGMFNFDLQQLLKMAEGKYPNTNNEREGIVIRPIEETFSETLQGRMSFKVINNLYLLKED